MYSRPGRVTTEILFWGLQRSGNHAVINWLLPQLEGKVAFFNNAWPEDPYGQPPSEWRGQQHQLDFSLVSFEDRPLPVVRSRWCYPSNGRGPEVHRRRHVLLLRDPFNFLASRLRSDVVPSSRTRFFTGLTCAQAYLAYLREFERRTCYLGADRVVVIYNQWKAEEAYRRQISRELGLKFSDEGFASVSHFGGGSSFDGLRLAADPQSMQTDRRWHQYRNSEVFRGMFRSRKLVAAGLKYFPSDGDLQHWALNLQRGGVRGFADEALSRALPPLVTFLRSSPVVRRLTRRPLPETPQPVRQADVGGKSAVASARSGDAT